MKLILKDQLEHRKVSLNAVVLTYNNICHIMIYMGALAKYSQVEMLLETLPRNMSANARMKLEPDLREPLMFKYKKIQMHILDKCVTTDTLTVLDMERVHTVPGVSPYSVPAGVPLL